jgi:DNA-binding MarR family transcriptional regulator
MPDLNPDERLRGAIELLYFGYREFTAGPDKILAQRGLSRMHHRILYFVGRNDAISVNALLEILRMSKQALHSPLRRLVALGLVSNATSAADRRVKQLRLTRAGQRLEQQLTGTQMELLAVVFADAGVNAEQGWLRVMQRLGT